MLLLDKIIFSLLIIFFLFGWFRGILKSLIGPLSCFLCSFFGVIYYDLNENLIAAALIILVGSIGLAIGLSMLFSLSLITVNKEFRGKTFLASRIAGSLINVVWQGNLMLLICIILAAIPAENSQITKLQSQIEESVAMRLYYQKVISRNPKVHAVIDSLFVLKEKETLEQLSTTKEYKLLLADKKFQAFLNSPEVIKGAETKNYLPIIRSPALKSLLDDPAVMEYVTQLAIKTYYINLNKIMEPVQQAAPAQQST